MLTSLRVTIGRIQSKIRVYFNKSLRIREVKELSSYPKHIRPYISKLLNICQKQNNIFWDTSINAFSKQQLSKLITLRLMDYFDSSIQCIKCRSYQSLFILLRSQCETLYLLKYLDKRPEKIKEFMEINTSKFYHMNDLIRDVNDINLKELYDYLSDIIHPNRIGIKFTHHIMKDINGNDTGRRLMTNIPLNYEEVLEDIMRSIISVNTSALNILEKWYNSKD